MAMAEAARRVALLARPGTACDNLQAALRDAGADVVLVADPTAGDAGGITDAGVTAVLVALDPSVEDALERYDAILLDPAMTVIYEEADLAARREGWDAARWTRHLAAKLAGHHDVLPPGTEAEGAYVAPASQAPPPEPEAQAEPTFEPTFEPTWEPTFESTPEPAFEAAAEPEPAFEPAFEPTFETAFEPDAEPAFETDNAHIEADPEPVELPVASFEGIRPDGELSLDDLDFELDPAPVAEPAEVVEVVEAASAADGGAAQAAEARPSFDFSALSLEEIPGEAPSPVAPAMAEPEAEAEATQPEPGEPPQAALDAPAAQAGGVVVLAGIGGPDAVRQFLAALPAGFPKPVLVRQRLDGGRHDRLVRQLQRATSLPVQLAEAGTPVAAGHVYILPDGMGTTGAEQGAPTFIDAGDPVPVLAGLPAADSAILVLSGSDAAAVPEIQAAAGAGALVAGQSPEECFDSEAPAALIAGGADGGAPADLAARLSARWLA